MYSNLIEEAEKNNLDMCHGGCRHWYLSGKSVGRNFRFENNIYLKDEIYKEILPCCVWFPPSEMNATALWATWTGIYRKEIIEKNKIHFLSERRYYSEDSIFNITFLKYVNKIGFVKGYFYNHVHSGNSLSSKEDGRIAKIDNWYEYINDLMITKNVTKGIIPYIQNTYLEMYRQELIKKHNFQRDMLKKYKHISEIKVFKFKNVSFKYKLNRFFLLKYPRIYLKLIKSKYN